MSWQSCALLWSSGGSPTRWLCLQKICRECGIQKQNASERFNNKLYGTKLLALEFYVKYQVQVMGVKRDIQAVHKSWQVLLTLPWDWPPSLSPLGLDGFPKQELPLGREGCF